MRQLAATEPKDRDAVLAAGALAVAALAIAGLVLVPGLDTTGIAQSPVVGHLKIASADLKRRPAQTLGWTTLHRGGEVRERDSLYVPPGVDGKVVFTDGSVLELDELTLVVLEPSKAGRPRHAVSLQKGSLGTTAGQTGLDVHTPQGNAELSAQTEAHLQLSAKGLELDVQKGVATVLGQRFESGQRANVDTAGVTALPPRPVQLLEPPANDRRFFRGSAPPIELIWAGTGLDHATLQLARDRGFAFVVKEIAGSQKDWTYAGDTGVFWWRVVDDSGNAMSESRRFSLLEDVPPQLILPKANDTVLSTDDSPAFFQWSEVRGVSHYRFEVSDRKDFTTIAFRQESDSAQLKAHLELPEGAWLWRVQPVDAEHGEAGPSPARAFRLVHKPLLDAPEQLDSVIELEDDPKK